MPVKIPAVPLERCLDSRDLSEPQVSPAGDVVVFGASQQGKGELRTIAVSGGSEEAWALEPAPSVTRGFGGGCFQWLPDGSGVVYAAKTGGLWEAARGATSACRIDTQAPVDASRFGVAVSPNGEWVACVQNLCELVVVHRATGEEHIITQPHAFVFDPVWNGDELFWQAWSQPHMPWDESDIWSAHIAQREAHVVLHRPGVSFQQVQFSATGEMGVLSDVDGWLQPYRVVAGELLPLLPAGEHVECGNPQWGMGAHTWCWSPDGREIAVARNLAGFGDLVVVSVASGEMRSLGRGVHGSLLWSNAGIFALRTGAVTPTQLVQYAAQTFEREILATSEIDSSGGTWSQYQLVEPTLGAVECGNYNIPYRLYSPVGSETSEQPLIVWVHGGPTDQWQVTFMARVAYWVGRGVRVMIVDHRGTSGHGRHFQQSLNGHWGEFDTADLIAAVQHAHLNGWAQPSNTFVMGGSAGGFAALNAAGTAPEMCAGVIALYPVVDLADSAEHSWYFEQHSIAVLVGDSPENETLYGERSPLSKVETLAQVKVLLLHGDLDTSVPMNHSVALAQALRKAGGQVSFHIMEGEGHGFRLRHNQLREYELIGEFIFTL
jgi:dipeptidyl aminopeptidase/acylaminoacyl peptidase